VEHPFFCLLFIIPCHITHSHSHAPLQSTSIEPVPEPVPDRAEINGLGSGPHDEDAQNKPRTLVGRSNVDTKYFEVRARAGTTCVVLPFATIRCSLLAVLFD
jgi:hypothetical protein